MTYPMVTFPVTLSEP